MLKGLSLKAYIFTFDLEVFYEILCEPEDIVDFKTCVDLKTL